MGMSTGIATLRELGSAHMRQMATNLARQQVAKDKSDFTRANINIRATLAALPVGKLVLVSWPDHKPYTNIVERMNFAIHKIISDAEMVCFVPSDNDKLMAVGFDNTNRINTISFTEGAQLFVLDDQSQVDLLLFHGQPRRAIDLMINHPELRKVAP